MIAQPAGWAVRGERLSAKEFYAKLRNARGRSCLPTYFFDIFVAFAFWSYCLMVALFPDSVRRRPQKLRLLLTSIATGNPSLHSTESGVSIQGMTRMANSVGLSRTSTILPGHCFVPTLAGGNKDTRATAALPGTASRFSCPMNRGLGPSACRGCLPAIRSSLTTD
jgi:hypothetical protein